MNRSASKSTAASPDGTTFWRRLVRGTAWTWINERFRAALPADLDTRVMSLESRDRYHAKQGRSTVRVVFHEGTGTRPLSVYLKRHLRLPWPHRLAALVDPAGRHTPGAAEWAHLERVRGLGIDVPEVVAAGERVGPWGRLQSFLMIAELSGRELNVIIPENQERLGPQAFTSWKRRLVPAIAEIAARLHAARLFHKDLYLCHFFLDETSSGPIRLTLIDLHRLGHHRVLAGRWRRKDLGQLLYSTFGVAGIDERDVLRFWVAYRRRLGLERHEARRLAVQVMRKAGRYQSHNQKKQLAKS